MILHHVLRCSFSYNSIRNVVFMQKHFNLDVMMQPKVSIALQLHIFSDILSMSLKIVQMFNNSLLNEPVFQNDKNTEM